MPRKKRTRFQARYCDLLTGEMKSADFPSKALLDEFRAKLKLDKIRLNLKLITQKELASRQQACDYKTLLAEFQEELESRGRSGHYVTQAIRQVEIVAVGCQFTMISDFDPAKVAGFLRAERSRKGWSAVNYNAYLKSVKAFCKWLAGQDKLANNPVDALPMMEETERERKRFERALTVAEATALLEAVPSDYRRMYYTFRLWTGLRGKEMARLLWSDVDFDRKVIRLRPEVTKNKKSCCQPLTEDLCSILAAAQPEEQPDETDVIFGLTPDKVVWRCDLRRAGITHSIHGRQADLMCLRKTFGTWARTARVDRLVIVDLMRHSHESGADLTFGTYADGEADIDRDKAEALDKMLRWVAQQQVDQKAGKSIRAA